MKTLRPHAYLIAVLVATTIYAVVRYNVFKGVPWSYLPLFVLNKAVAWSSLMLLAAAAWQGVRGRSQPGTSRFARQGLALAGAHVVMSVVLLRPPSFPDLFDATGCFTWRAQVALLAGVVALGAVLAARRSAPAVMLTLPGAIAVHTAFLGAPGWLTPGKWPGRMVPITLLSFLVAVTTLVLVVIWWRRQQGTD